MIKYQTPFTSPCSWGFKSDINRIDQIFELLVECRSNHSPFVGAWVLSINVEDFDHLWRNVAEAFNSGICSCNNGPQNIKQMFLAHSVCFFAWYNDKTWNCSSHAKDARFSD